MSRVRAVLAILLAPIVLAGCAEEAAPTAVETPTVILVTDENDMETLANDSFMMAAHQHDYWGGKDRLVVAETTLANPGCCTTLGGSGVDFVFPPDDGRVVPHGTARVAITFSWVDAPTSSFYSAPELWLQTAAEHEASLIGPVTSGTPVEVETDDADLDLPHQSLSAWRFILHFEPYMGTPYTDKSGGEITLHVEAIRGREIPVYPPHPDLWDGKSAIPLFDDVKSHAVWTGTVDEDGRSYSCFSGCWPVIHRVVNGTVVPFDATMVEIVLDAQPDPTFDFGLKYHGADTRNFTDVEPASVEGTKRTYQIPVALGAGDSPYAVQSVWGVTVFSMKPERDGWFAGAYTITARVLKD